MYFLDHISERSTSSTFKIVPSFQQIKCLGLSDYYGSSLESLTDLQAVNSLHQKSIIFICLSVHVRKRLLYKGKIICKGFRIIIRSSFDIQYLVFKPKTSKARPPSKRVGGCVGFSDNSDGPVRMELERRRGRIL